MPKDDKPAEVAAAPERDTLPPGELPHITDTAPPPLHASTVILPGEIRIVDPPLTVAEVDMIEAARADAKSANDKAAAAADKHAAADKAAADKQAAADKAAEEKAHADAVAADKQAAADKAAAPPIMPPLPLVMPPSAPPHGETVA